MPPLPLWATQRMVHFWVLVVVEGPVLAVEVRSSPLASVAYHGAVLAKSSVDTCPWFGGSLKKSFSTTFSLKRCARCLFFTFQLFSDCFLFCFLLVKPCPTCLYNAYDLINCFILHSNKEATLAAWNLLSASKVCAAIKVGSIARGVLLESDLLID